VKIRRKNSAEKIIVKFCRGNSAEKNHRENLSRKFGGKKSGANFLHYEKRLTIIIVDIEIKEIL
jgi:hypothetical protein